MKFFIIYNFLFEKRIFQDFTEKWAVPNAEPMKALEKLADWMNGTGSFLSNMKMIERYGNYWTQLQIRIKIKKNFGRVNPGFLVLKPGSTGSLLSPDDPYFSLTLKFLEEINFILSMVERLLKTQLPNLLKYKRFLA